MVSVPLVSCNFGKPFEIQAVQLEMHVMSTLETADAKSARKTTFEFWVEVIPVWSFLFDLMFNDVYNLSLLWSSLIPIPPGSPSTKIMRNCSQNRWRKLRECHVKSFEKHSPRLQGSGFQILHTATIHHHKTTTKQQKFACFSYIVRCCWLVWGC